MQMVSEVMTRNVQFVSPEETVRRAAEMMDDLNVGALPVCDGDRLVGMVTDRDITVRVTSAGIAPDDATVDDVMSTDVRWCFEDQPLDEVMQQMSDTQIRRVPVVSHDEAHRLVGIVSLGDIATKAGTQGQVEQVVERVSFPAAPDLSGQQPQQPPAPGEVRMSDVGTATGLAGSDMLDDRLDPDVENISTADPSDLVEVTPNELVNRNAPGSKALNVKRAGDANGTPVVRHVQGNAGDTTSGESGAPAGTDATGVSGASGGGAGTSGSPGTGIGAGR
ncbi:CBS domain-containing protein [Noviherbaspirillum humi]|uniref:CBS domain-containing protein n=1 Tax=Noviherbaspirillum humi TaxID=1688639 RepID=A0A239HPS2_9BURK|nr:CBS domain-containing protein [Noviherbaspirillum humi]